jgi:hypothetical protein
MSGAAPTLEFLQVLERENGELREENAALRAKIEWLRKELFGPGKSEKLDRAQLLLKLGELEKLAAAQQACRRSPTSAAPRRARSARCRGRTSRTCR